MTDSDILNLFTSSELRAFKRHLGEKHRLPPDSEAVENIISKLSFHAVRREVDEMEDAQERKYRRG